MEKKITLETLDANNWLKICDLSVTDEQKAFFPISNLYWIGISRYEEKTELFAIKTDDEYIGLIGGGFDEDGVTGYINPLMIDHHYQRNGYGKQAVQLIIKYLKDNLNVNKINLGHRKENVNVGYLYGSLGFKIIKDLGNQWYKQLDLTKD
jgi:RimJ/RimL family protein N-acetyltransferase